MRGTKWLQKSTRNSSVPRARDIPSERLTFAMFMTAGLSTPSLHFKGEGQTATVQSQFQRPRQGYFCSEALVQSNRMHGWFCLQPAATGRADPLGEPPRYPYRDAEARSAGGEAEGPRMLNCSNPECSVQFAPNVETCPACGSPAGEPVRTETLDLKQATA